MTDQSTRVTSSSPLLTSSEKAILQMVAEGYATDDISQVLDISKQEIEGLLDGVERKLSAHNRLHAITIAVLNGHISIGPENPSE
jgi:DNA-binding CsgD family transcriptional regulator